MVGGDGQMIELAEHPRLLAARLRTSCDLYAY
jgi:hypothetical protein